MTMMSFILSTKWTVTIVSAFHMFFNVRPLPRPVTEWAHILQYTIPKFLVWDSGWKHGRDWFHFRIVWWIQRQIHRFQRIVRFWIGWFELWFPRRESNNSADAEVNQTRGTSQGSRSCVSSVVDWWKVYSSHCYSRWECCWLVFYWNWSKGLQIVRRFIWWKNGGWR